MATAGTPGVYVNELNAFPASAVEVPTAVPAFIGYTPKAEYEGKSLANKARKISSFAEFQAMYMLDDPSARQYSPEYYLVPQDQRESDAAFLSINGRYYSIVPDPDTIYYLYNSIRLFYLNGGGDAYIVSVGGYGTPSNKPLADSRGRPVNANMKLADLQRGLALLANHAEPTMYICPEATLLSPADNGVLMQSMLEQAEQLQTLVCLFDVIGGADPDPVQYTHDIDNFRTNTGEVGLKYGVCYYPFIGTTVMQPGAIDFTNLFGGDTAQLAALLNPNADAARILDQIAHLPPHPLSNSQLHQALLGASETYAQIIKRVLDIANVLPPSGAMAGVYARTDNAYGVWQAPANTSVAGAVSLPILLTDSQQENMNVDPVSGKSINAIRFFNSYGILVWGARTLDGNSDDWRYVSVRRTVTFIEQSIKLATRAYVFAPNDIHTWTTVKSMIQNFLENIWKQGGLMGASAADAFSVDVGLGTTMTSDDLLNGYMRVAIKLAVVRPAEFIVITFEQQQSPS